MPVLRDAAFGTPVAVAVAGRPDARSVAVAVAVAVMGTPAKKVRMQLVMTGLDSPL